MSPNESVPEQFKELGYTLGFGLHSVGTTNNLARSAD